MVCKYVARKLAFMMDEWREKCHARTCFLEEEGRQGSGGMIMKNVVISDNDRPSSRVPRLLTHNPCYPLSDKLGCAGMYVRRLEFDED